MANSKVESLFCDATMCPTQEEQGTSVFAVDAVWCCLYIYLFIFVYYGPSHFTPKDCPKGPLNRRQQPKIRITQPFIITIPSSGYD